MLRNKGGPGKLTLQQTHAARCPRPATPRSPTGQVPFPSHTSLLIKAQSAGGKPLWPAAACRNPSWSLGTNSSPSRPPCLPPATHPQSPSPSPSGAPPSHPGLSKGGTEGNQSVSSSGPLPATAPQPRGGHSRTPEAAHPPLLPWPGAPSPGKFHWAQLWPRKGKPHGASSFLQSSQRSHYAPSKEKLGSAALPKEAKSPHTPPARREGGREGACRPRHPSCARQGSSFGSQTPVRNHCHTSPRLGPLQAGLIPPPHSRTICHRYVLLAAL